MMTKAKIFALTNFIGFIGIFIIIVLVFFDLRNLFFHQIELPCKDAQLLNIVPPLNSKGVQVTGINTVEIKRNHLLCIRVVNVVNDEKIKEVGNKVVSTAIAALQKGEIAKASAELVSRKVLATSDQNAVVASAVALNATQDAEKAQQDNVNAQAVKSDLEKVKLIVLYLNGKASPLTSPARPLSAPQILTFDISAPQDATDGGAAFWRDLLSQPSSGRKIPMRVAVAEQGQPAPAIEWDAVDIGAGKTSKITYILFEYWTMVFSIATLVCLLIGFLGIAAFTRLLRSGTKDDASYSLSLVQMACWLFLTTTGFVYIWIVTGQYIGVFTSGLFILIGISGATAGVAQTLDYNLKEIPKSNGFLNDIAGKWSGGQFQLQRLQIIAWTIILAAIFVSNLVSKLVLTTFDTNLLALTGIANGVYVSLKPQETPKA